MGTNYVSGFRCGSGSLLAFVVYKCLSMTRDSPALGGFETAPVAAFAR